MEHSRQPELVALFDALAAFNFSTRRAGRRYHRFSDYAVLQSPSWLTHLFADRA